jgi:sulfonate transport system ATP-binding protein
MPDVGAQQALEIDITRKVYRRADGATLEAVRDLRLSAGPREFVCLIGPSGCGKTTTLRILLGLDRGFEGQVRPGCDRRRVGVVFQEPRLLPWRTVEQNIRLAAPSASGRALDGLLADFGLQEWRTLYPGELSLGMARRAALARALAIDPDLLILDEPFASLDEHAAAELRALLGSIVRRRRMTVLMVTHDLREALGIADRLILLTPRPAKVLADIRLSTPRDERTEAWVEHERNGLMGRLPALNAENPP